MNSQTPGVPVEPAHVIQVAVGGRPPRRLPLCVNRAEWNALLARGEIQPVDKLTDGAIAINILGDN